MIERAFIQPANVIWASIMSQVLEDNSKNRVGSLLPLSLQTVMKSIKYMIYKYEGY